MRRERARSFSLEARTSTIRFPYVLPSRIIVIVESMLRTSFCAVPAFSRVEPVSSSGPTTTSMPWSAAAPSALSALQDRPTVSAPSGAGVLDRADRVRRAAGGGDRRPPCRPRSAASASRSAAASSLLSSAPSTDVTMAAGPPAIRPTTSAGSVLKVGGHSLASSTPSRPGGARARVDQPAAAGHPLGGGVDRGGDPRQLRGDGGGDGRVLAVHDPGDLQGGQPVDLGQLGPERLGGEGLQLGAELAVGRRRRRWRSWACGSFRRCGAACGCGRSGRCSVLCGLGAVRAGLRVMGRAAPAGRVRGARGSGRLSAGAGRAGAPAPRTRRTGRGPPSRTSAARRL